MSTPQKSSSRGVAKRPPWKRANPRPKAARVRLSEEAKVMARARAEKAGRRYPNLIDNMWAAENMKRERN